MEKRQKVKRYFEVSESSQTIQRSIETVIAQFRKVDEDDPHGLRIGNEVADKLSKSFWLAKQQILDYLEGLYEELLTEDELDALIAYHSSPVAIRMRELAPEFFQRIQQKTVKLLRKNMETPVN